MAIDTLVGRLVDLTGRRILADQELALVGRAARPDAREQASSRRGRPQLLATATTADDGSFVTSRPPGRYTEVWVILGDGSGRLHVELERDGTVPDEVVIFLTELESHLRYAN